jgi:hypothetical protein
MAAELGRPDFIKIDAEGAEAAIFRGMKGMLNSNPGIRVVMEFAPTLLERAGTDPAGFLNDLTASGYRILRIDDMTGETVDVAAEQLRVIDSSNILLERFHE